MADATKKKKNKKRIYDFIKCRGGCGKDRAITRYYKSTNPKYDDYNGYCTICKDCLADILLDMKTDSISATNFKKVCDYLDMPYVPALYTDVMMREGVNYKNFIGEYKKNINLNKKWKTARYVDSYAFEDDTIIVEELMQAGSKTELEQELERKKKELKNQVTMEMIEFWGFGKKDEEYVQLQTMYDGFLENEDEATFDFKKQTDYKTLCELEIMKRRLLLDGSKINELTKVISAISDISKDLNIKAIQKKEDNSNKGAYDLFIKRIEQTEPIFDFERDLGNRDEVQELLQLYFYGYLMDVIGRNTEFTKDLHEELEKYTPNYTVEEDEDGDE